MLKHHTKIIMILVALAGCPGLSYAEGTSLFSIWSKKKTPDYTRPEYHFQGESLRLAHRIAANASNFDEFDPSLLNKPGVSGNTPLIFALSNKRYASIEGLVRKGANPTQEIEGLGSPLRLAALSNDPQLLTALFNAGVDPNFRNKEGTPLVFLP